MGWGHARRIGPDQQDGAGGVVDDETAGRAEAARAEVGVVAVAGEHEQVGAFSGGDDFPFDAAGALMRVQGRPSRPAASGGAVPRMRSRGGPAGGQGRVRDMRGRATGVGATGDTGDLGGGDVQQRNVASPARGAGGVDAGRPGASTIQARTTVTVISLR